MIETQIVVKTLNGENWYTVQKRNVYFLFRGFWQNVKPTMLSNLEQANKIQRELKWWHSKNK